MTYSQWRPPEARPKQFRLRFRLWFLLWFRRPRTAWPAIAGAACDLTPGLSMTSTCEAAGSLLLTAGTLLNVISARALSARGRTRRPGRAAPRPTTIEAAA